MSTRRRKRAIMQKLAANIRLSTLARDFKLTVVERVERDPAFARALLDEAAQQGLQSAFIEFDPELHGGEVMTTGRVGAEVFDSDLKNS
jgi:hypothetical protein